MPALGLTVGVAQAAATRPTDVVVIPGPAPQGPGPYTVVISDPGPKDGGPKVANVD
jgi:hypothetical protein